MKNFLIVVCVIVVVCLLGYAGQYMDDSTQQVNTVASNKNQNTSSSKPSKIDTSNNKVNNKKDENQTNKEDKKEEVVDNKKEEVEDDKKEEEKIEQDKKEPVVEENSISSEDKAIKLAKETYGNSNDVYFKVEQIVSNGVYIISVRDNETTEAYAWYNVDVNTGIVK